jgi:hypothetical protein
MLPIARKLSCITLRTHSSLSDIQHFRAHYHNAPLPLIKICGSQAVHSDLAIYENQLCHWYSFLSEKLALMRRGRGAPLAQELSCIVLRTHSSLSDSQ